MPQKVLSVDNAWTVQKHTQTFTSRDVPTSKSLMQATTCLTRGATKTMYFMKTLTSSQRTQMPLPTSKPGRSAITTTTVLDSLVIADLLDTYRTPGIRCHTDQAGKASDTWCFWQTKQRELRQSSNRLQNTLSMNLCHLQKVQTGSARQ